MSQNKVTQFPFILAASYNLRQ